MNYPRNTNYRPWKTDKYGHGPYHSGYSRAHRQLRDRKVFRCSHLLLHCGVVVYRPVFTRADSLDMLRLRLKGMKVRAPS